MKMTAPLGVHPGVLGFIENFSWRMRLSPLYQDFLEAAILFVANFGSDSETTLDQLTHKEMRPRKLTSFSPSRPPMYFSIPRLMVNLSSERLPAHSGPQRVLCSLILCLLETPQGSAFRSFIVLIWGEKHPQTKEPQQNSCSFSSVAPVSQ